jgi:hypothetical protein
MELEISQRIFEKSSNIKFNENLSSGSRVVSCRQTDGRTDMTKVIVAFRNFANAPTSVHFFRNQSAINSVQPSDN